MFKPLTEQYQNTKLKDNNVTSNIGEEANSLIFNEKGETTNITLAIVKKLMGLLT